MATASNEDRLSDEIIRFLSNPNNEGTPITNQALLEHLADVKTELKDLEIRHGLEDYLYKFNLNLDRVKLVRSELAKSTISIATVGDKMVSMVKQVKYHYCNLYPQTENGVQNEQTNLQIAMDRTKLTELTNLPELCIEDLTNLRRLIQRCLTLHTELFLMGNEFQELIENVKLLNIDIPIYQGSNYSGDQMNFEHIFKRESYSVGIGAVLGGIIGLISGGTFAGILLASLECHSCCLVIGHAFLGLGCTTCAITCVVPLLGAAALFSLCVTLGALTGWAWDVGSKRRTVLEEIYKFRDKLRKSKVQIDLATMIDKLDAIQQGAKNNLQAKEGSAISPSQLNIIMKAYKEYRKCFEKARNNTRFAGRTDAALHEIVRIGASIVIEPLEISLSLSEEKCWELLDAIHETIQRNRPD